VHDGAQCSASTMDLVAVLLTVRVMKRPLT
jgi:hypothetical protein